MSQVYLAEKATLSHRNTELQNETKTCIISNFNSIMCTLEALLQSKFEEQNLEVYAKLRTILDSINATLTDITTKQFEPESCQSSNEYLTNKSIILESEIISLIENCFSVSKTTADFTNEEGK